MATSSNPSLQVTLNHSLSVTDAPIRTLRSGEALIHVQATGICGSDVHLWKHGSIGPAVLQANHILGHESAGTVLKIDPQVSHIKVGDRVAIEPLVTCGTCTSCSVGRSNLYDRSTLRGVYGPGDEAHGSLQRYFVHPAKLLHVIPPSMSFSQGALLEPLSVSLQATRNANLQLGSPVLVCGAGPIGLLALACARASGAWPLVVTDVEPKRLEFAREFMPGLRTHLVNTGGAPEEEAARLRGLFVQAASRSGDTDDLDVQESTSPTSVLECTGFSSSIITACHAVRKSGTVMIVGAGQPVLDGIPSALMMQKEITLKSSRVYKDTWPACINLIAGGLINLDKLVTHVFPLEKADEALATAADPSQGSIKVQVIDNTNVKT
ncbi:hypothetical protein CDV31_005682 [Fusarium ambrosium]|uniref:Enoyl reductase (ER) domain-containing protein n=1 Tax=Fusarium ambrosium TaxID=131363 RepID=A0A428UHU0_9HYPO|nr:hypothetical protein CDV31_005682 [Fusarium ambrosium]